MSKSGPVNDVMMEFLIGNSEMPTFKVDLCSLQAVAEKGIAVDAKEALSRKVTNNVELDRCSSRPPCGSCLGFFAHYVHTARCVSLLLMEEDVQEVAREDWVKESQKGRVPGGGLSSRVGRESTQFFGSSHG